ncbi:MAG: AAA family ATPase, partial [Vicinamibacteria bacterium]
DSGELDNAGGSGYLAYLAGNEFLEETLGYYVGIIKDDSLMRSVWRRGAEVMKAVEKKEGWEKIDGIIEKLSGARVEERSDNPVPVSARDLADIPPPPSLWADIIYPGCIIQLNSEPGAGKSTLAYNICALGACGKPFLDVAFSKRLKSLYADLETPRFLRKNKIELICGELPADFYIIDNIELRRDFNYLLRLCKRGRYDLLVLDTQSRVLAMEKENDNSEANYLAGLLRRIANEAGCAILLIHHSTKGEEGKAVYRGRGASAIAGAVDVVVNLDALGDDTLRLSVVKHRIQGSNPRLLLRKSGEDRFEPCPDQGGGDEPGFALYRAQDAAVALLSQSLVPMRTGEIIEAVQKETSIDKRTIERALGRLAQSGRVSRPRKGYYECRRN